MAVDWGRLREEFPALAQWTFLNTATYGQTPQRAYGAVEAHFRRRDELACGDFLTWFDDADRIRGLLGKLVNCAAEDIAFLPTTALALSLLLGGIEWKRGDRVVTLTHEFPTNIYGPALLAERGVEFVEVPWEEFWGAISHASTRLVALSTVSYSTGFRPPLEEIAEACRRRGILLYVDGTQSVGALRIDVARIQPAMLAVDAYKWMLTPNGAGFVYVSPETRAWLKPQAIGWRSHWDWRSVDQLHHGAPQFSPHAERYEGAMLPFPMLYALGAVTELLLEVGLEAIEQRVLALAGLLRRELRGLGAEVDEQASPIVTARWAGRDARALARELRERRILVSARHGRLRVSPHFYNNESDLETLLRAL